MAIGWLATNVVRWLSRLPVVQGRKCFAQPMAILMNSACIGQFLSNSEVNGGTEGCLGWTGRWS